MDQNARFDNILANQLASDQRLQRMVRYTAGHACFEINMAAEPASPGFVMFSGPSHYPAATANTLADYRLKNKT